MNSLQSFLLLSNLTRAKENDNESSCGSSFFSILSLASKQKLRMKELKGEEQDSTLKQMSVSTKPNDYWQRVYEAFKNNPFLLSGGVLNMVLKRRPPSDLVKLMLKLNPDSATIPKNGPSSLQVAVERNCSIETISLLIEACPFSLVATNPDHGMTPLIYAKRFRSDETELIQLLSYPIAHWISRKNAQIERHDGCSLAKPMYNYGPPLKIPSTPYTKHCNTIALQPTGHQQASSHTVESIELKNLKKICSALTKKNRKLWKEMQALKENVTQSSLRNLTLDTGTELSQLETKMREEEKDCEWKKRMAEVENKLTTDITAMEKRVLGLLQKSESMCLKTVDHRFDSFSKNVQYRLHSTTSRLNNLEYSIQQSKKKSKTNGGKYIHPPIGILDRDRIHTLDDSGSILTSSLTTYVEERETSSNFATTWPYNMGDSNGPSTFCMDDGNDDVRSLLSDDLLLDRKKCTWRQWVTRNRFRVIHFST